MSKKPSAANITHGLAQLGGGSKAEGGDGMLGGIVNIFKAGIDYGAQLALNKSPSPKGLEMTTLLQLGDGDNGRN